MSLYSDFQKNKEKQGDSSNKSLYSKFKEQKNYVPTTFTQRMTGEPVRQKDGSFRPTVGITNVLSELPIIGPFARGAKTYGETRAYNSLDDKTRQLVDVNEIAPDINRKKSEIIFDAGEAAIDAATGGVSSLFRKGVVKTGVLATSKARKLADLSLTRSQILKRAGVDTALNTGAAYEYEVGQNVREGKTGVDALKPGAGTPLVAMLTGVLGAKNATELSNKISASKIAEKYSQKFNVPNAGTPPMGYFKQLPSPRTPSETPIELPSKGILKSAEDLRNPTKIPTPETPKSSIEQKAFENNSRQSFIDKELRMQKLGKDINKSFGKSGMGISNIGKETPTQLGKIWDSQHPNMSEPIKPTRVTLTKTDPVTGKPIEAPTTTLPETAPKSNLTQQGEIPTPETGQPKVDTSTPKESPHLSSIEDSLGKQDNTSRQTNPELRLGDLKTRSARIDKLHTEDPSTLERIAMGLETHPEISQEDALGGLSRIATDTGDSRLIDKLTESNVGSQAGSDFNGLKLAGENNIVKVIRDLKLSIEKKFPNTFKKSKIETDEAFKKINKYMKENNIPDKEFNNIMDNFVCK